MLKRKSFDGYTVGYAKMKDAIKNECYNEQFLSVKIRRLQLTQLNLDSFFKNMDKRPPTDEPPI
jgi:hypothetical protein